MIGTTSSKAWCCCSASTRPCRCSTASAISGGVEYVEIAVGHQDQDVLRPDGAHQNDGRNRDGYLIERDGARLPIAVRVSWKPSGGGHRRLDDPDVAAVHLRNDGVDR